MRSPEKPPWRKRNGLAWHTLDLKQPEQVRRTLAEISPDVVIHAAAIADIDFCERHPDVARAVNVGLTQAVADSCSERRVRLVYISTDNVFDGERGNYVEADPPSPINEYARTKAEGEAIAAGRLRFDHREDRAGDGFRTAGRRELVPGTTRSQCCGPGRRLSFRRKNSARPSTCTRWATRLLELAAGSLAGTIHLAGSDALDRVSLTRWIAERFGYSPGLVQPRPPAQIAGRRRGRATFRCPTPKPAPC